jgi:hypothetical protein
VTVELARRLLSTGAVQARDVEAALYLSVARGVSVARALVDGGALSERALDEELSRGGGLAARQIVASTRIAARLPRGLCRMLAAVPTRVDPATGVVEVATVDSLDAHVAAEFGFHLGQPVRLVRGTIGAVEEAIRRMELGQDGVVGERTRRKTPAFPHGAPDSVPPPPPVPAPEEVPIPLVRRTSMAPPSDANDVPLLLSVERSPSNRGTRGVAGPRAEPPRTITSSATEARPATPPGPPVVEPSAPIAEPGSRSGGSLRPSLLVEPSPAAPAVSFPSSPPPAMPARTDAFVGAGSVARLSEPPPPPAPAIPRAPIVPSPSPSKPTLELDPSELTPLPEERGPALPVPGATGATFASLAEILGAIARAVDRDAIIELALTAMLRVAERAAVFVVRREQFQGWVCNPAFGAEQQLRDVVVPQRMPSVLATAVAAGYYLGPIPGTAAHASLVGVMGRASREVSVVVVRVAGRPALLLLADELDDTLLGTRAMGEIASQVGAALERVVLRKV